MVLFLKSYLKGFHFVTKIFVFICFMQALILVSICVLFSFKFDNFLNLNCVKIEIFTVCYNSGSKRICQSTGKQATYTDLSISCMWVYLGR